MTISKSKISNEITVTATVEEMLTPEQRVEFDKALSDFFRFGSGSFEINFEK